MNFLKRKKKSHNAKDWGDISANIIEIILYTGIGAIIYAVIYIISAITKWIL